jgi:hypothetical protein
LGPRLNPEDFYPARHKNEVAVQKARMDRQEVKFMPDTQFWKQRPEYGYRELPILDTGTQSIYLESEPKYIIIAPRSVDRKGHGIVRFWNKDAESECQGFFDDLAKVFQAY